MLAFLNSLRPQGDKNGNTSELKYDPQCGMSNHVFEWQCRQFDKVSSRTPELMRKMRARTQKMRAHFKNDPEALKKWDAYEANVLNAYECDLKRSLSRCMVTPNSVLYEDLMKRKAYSKTCIGLLLTGLGKFKFNTRSLGLVVAGAAIGLTAGLGVSLKQQKIKK